MVTSELKEDPMLANYDIKNYGACHQWRTSKSTCSAQTCVGSQPAFRSLGSSRHTFAENGCGGKVFDLGFKSMPLETFESSKSTSLP
ncbi:hypothetical protein SLE2022_111240 [Rubroshorea leprosula]